MQHREESESLSPRVIFETIRIEGEEEINRPLRALWFSGVAAGILIAFSVLGEAYLRTYLPDESWRYILENFGYTFGFLLVVLGRMQLFTENTITTVVPVMIHPNRKTLTLSSRLWAVVLFANLVGAFLVAWFLAYSGVLDAQVHANVVDLSKHATGFPPMEGFIRGIPAGVLIAALVWMMPSVPGSPIALIVLFTWLIALGDFTHIIAGSVEMAFLLVQGLLEPSAALFSFFLPVLAGNVVGGTVVFTMLAWGQIQPEIDAQDNK